MSRLVERLERISEGRGQPLGFGASAVREKASTMLVVAAVRPGDAALAAATAEGGADALLMAIPRVEQEGALAQLRSVKTEIPWGVSLDTVDKQDLGKLIEMGCDFVVFAPTGTAAAVLTEDRIGKVLQVEPSLGENLVKSIGRLPVDAVLLNPLCEGDTPLTVHKLMVSERLIVGAGKHAIAAVPASVLTDDLEILRELGVRGVLVDLAGGDHKQRLSQVREAIGKLPTKRKKPGEKMTARLPSFSELAERPPRTEEEEEEEEP